MNLNDLKRLTAFDEISKPRYFVRSVGSTTESDRFNTWCSLGSAERYRAGMRELNPGVEFEIIDLTTGEPVKPAHTFRDKEVSIEARVWDVGPRGWSVTMCDLDSGESLPGKVFPREREADAIAYAKSIAYGSAT